MGVVDNHAWPIIEMYGIHGPYQMLRSKGLSFVSPYFDFLTVATGQLLRHTDLEVLQLIFCMDDKDSNDTTNNYIVVVHC